MAEIQKKQISANTDRFLVWLKGCFALLGQGWKWLGKLLMHKRKTILVVLAIFEIWFIFFSEQAKPFLDQLETAVYGPPHKIVQGQTLPEATLKQLEARGNLRNALALFLPGLIPAFFLWSWRNQDKKDDLQNQAITNNQTNFHKLVEWLHSEDEGIAATAAHQFARFLTQPDLKEFFGESAFRAIYAKLETWGKAPETVEALDAWDQWDALSEEEKRKELEKKSPAIPAEIIVPQSIQGLHRLFLKRPGAFTSWEMQEIQLPFAKLFESGRDGLQTFQGNQAHLSFANLRMAELNHADFSRANLHHANLWCADLFKADLSGANLLLANLNRAFLPYAKLRGADLTYAKLNRAYLEGADLEGADLEGADLEGTDLTGCKVNEQTNFYGAMYNHETKLGNLDPVALGMILVEDED